MAKTLQSVPPSDEYTGADEMLNPIVPKTGNKRQHVATYATDKRKGGYTIRVVGPNAECFAGREVPVQTMAGAEHKEMLLKLLWTGTDTGTEKVKGTGLPVALYSFKSKPRGEQDVDF